jgi:OOP family OmpA-OmpF porin
VDARYHFRNADSKWWPYVRGGIGWQRHEEEYDAFPNPNSPGQHEDSNLALNLGAGLQFDFGRVDLRTEVGTRVDFDDVQARIGSQEDMFTDLLASVGLTVALGPEPVAPVAPAPVAEASPARTWMTTVTASTTATTSARVRRLARPSVRTAARCRSRST